MSKFRNSRVIKVLCVVAVIIAILIIFRGFILGIAGRILDVEDNIGKVDAILVLSGESSGEREETAVRLYNEGYSDTIIMSGGPVGWNTTHASIMKRHAEYLGVDGDDIILEDQSETTYENAVYSKKIVADSGFDSMMIVTSAYHMRRALYIHRKVFKDMDIDIYWCSAQVPYFSPSAWWKNDKGIKALGMEYLKFIWYIIRY